MLPGAAPLEAAEHDLATEALGHPAQGGRGLAHDFASQPVPGMTCPPGPVPANTSSWR